MCPPTYFAVEYAINPWMVAGTRSRRAPRRFTLGKALGGGILPVSAVVADERVLGVLRRQKIEAIHWNVFSVAPYPKPGTRSKSPRCSRCAWTSWWRRTGEQSAPVTMS